MMLLAVAEAISPEDYRSVVALCWILFLLVVALVVALVVVLHNRDQKDTELLVARIQRDGAWEKLNRIKEVLGEE